jgi:GNAT superfamily N-acetyltransferase
MTIPIREVSRAERPALQRHFLALDGEDRRLRFGIPLGDFAVRSYVERIDFEHDAVFGTFGETLELLGVAHLARSEKHAELGISVLAGHRQCGIGGALLARAHTRARNWAVRALFVHCLAENAAMMRLARRQGMRVVCAAGEADAWLELPPADAASHFGEVFDERVALFDYALKAQLASARILAGAFRPGRVSLDQEK